MAKSTTENKAPTVEGMSPEQMAEMIKGLAAKVAQMEREAGGAEEEESSPETSNLSNANARLVATQVGDCLQVEGYQTPIPESVTEKGPAAVEKFLRNWRKGLTAQARSLGGPAADMATQAQM
jgi:hypothetical protein